MKSLPDLLQSSSIIGSAIRETETVSVTSLVSKINVEGGGGGVQQEAAGLWKGKVNRKEDSP